MTDEDLTDDGTDSPPDVVALPITRELDLHTFHPRDFTAVVADYLEEARARGFSRVRIIHGRGLSLPGAVARPSNQGIGFQRQEVQKVLARHPAVASFSDDLDARLGATWVDLKPPELIHNFS